MVLSARLLLLLSVLGEFILAYRALGAYDNLGIVICVVFGGVTILPLVFLSLRGTDVPKQEA